MKGMALVFGLLMVVHTGMPEVATAGGSSEALPDIESLWDYQDPGATERAFRDLLPLARATLDTSYYLQLMTQIARTQGLRQQFDAAHATLDTVSIMLSDRFPVAEIRYLLERGRVYNSSGNPEGSQRYFLEAWGMALEHSEEYHEVDALHMMGIVTPPAEQLKWSLRAMRASEQARDARARKWLGPLYNNIGWSYHDLGRYERALEFFEKSLAWRTAEKDEHGTRIARWTIGRVYRSLGRIDEALAIHRALEREISDKGLDQDGYVFEELAECLLLTGAEREARTYAAKAYELLSGDPWLAKNATVRLERLQALGRE